MARWFFPYFIRGRAILIISPYSIFITLRTEETVNF